MANQTKILIRNFTVPALVGIYDHEKNTQQRVRISVETTLADHEPSHDDIEDTISYETLVAEIRQMRNRHFNLVETMAEHLAQLVLKDKRAGTVLVRVEKLDVYPEGSVGTEIIRSRKS